VASTGYLGNRLYLGITSILTRASPSCRAIARRDDHSRNCNDLRSPGTDRNNDLRQPNDQQECGRHGIGHWRELGGLKASAHPERTALPPIRATAIRKAPHLGIGGPAHH